MLRGNSTRRRYGRWRYRYVALGKRLMEKHQCASIEEAYSKELQEARNGLGE